MRVSSIVRRAWKRNNNNNNREQREAIFFKRKNAKPIYRDIIVYTWIGTQTDFSLSRTVRVNHKYLYILYAVTISRKKTKNHARKLLIYYCVSRTAQPPNTTTTTTEPSARNKGKAQCARPPHRA